jgi:hypothetical protein
MTVDPGLVNYQPDGSGDYHLRADSPCIETGVPDGAPPFDFDGIPRPQGGHYSIGPYEKQPSGSPFVQGASLTNFVQGASASLAYGSNNAAGNTLVAMVRVTNPSGAIIIADTQGNAWTSRQQVTNGTSTMVWFDAIGGKAGANTVTVSQSSSSAFLELCIAEYSNVTAFDQQASTTGSGSTGTTPSINLATGNELVIGWFSNETQNSLSFTAGSGFTLRNNSAGNVVFEESVASGSGSLSASMGVSASVSWFAGILAYQTNLRNF